MDYKQDKVKRVSYIIKSTLECLLISVKILLVKLQHKKVIFLFFTPTHSNIGDAAITIAEEIFIHNNFPEYTLFEIEDKYIYNFGVKHLRLICKIIGNQIILIQGGGFIGTLWYESGNKPIWRIINASTLKNKIFIMPQTIYFEDSEFGLKTKLNIRACCEKHKNFKICTREYYSYDIAKELKLNAFLIPDMVLYQGLKNILPVAKERNKIGICLRDDIEAIISPADYKKLSNILSQYDESISISMIAANNIMPKERWNIVNRQIDLFASLKLVITDRLHAMLLAAITGTPCIVINSKSHKVKGCYEWLKPLGYIFFIDDINERINDLINSAIQTKGEYNLPEVNSYFEKLEKLIKNEQNT